MIQKMDFEMVEEVTVEFVQNYLCEAGHILSFEETGGDEHEGEGCPLRCGETLHTFSKDESTIYYCKNPDCKQSHVTTLTPGQCLQCDKAKVRLSQEPAYLEAEVEEQTFNKEERQLASLLQKAQSFVESSGSHHKSKGGRHTSSASEMHSSAHQSKKQVRDTYAEKINNLLDSGKINNKKLAKKAKEMIGKVQNK